MYLIAERLKLSKKKPTSLIRSYDQTSFILSLVLGFACLGLKLFLAFEPIPTYVLFRQLIKNDIK